jgi:hypothetical protein
MTKATLFGLLGIFCLLGGCSKQSQVQPVATGSKPSVVQAAAPPVAPTAAPLQTSGPLGSLEIAGSYKGVSCSNGSPLEWDKVSFSGSDDAASFSLTSNADTLGNPERPQTLTETGRRASGRSDSPTWVFEHNGYISSFSKQGSEVTGIETEPDGSVLSEDLFFPDDGQDLLAFAHSNKYLCLQVSFGEVAQLNSTEQATLRFINGLFETASLQDGEVESSQKVAIYGKKLVFVADFSVSSYPSNLSVWAANFSDLDPNSIVANNGAVLIFCKGLTLCAQGSVSIVMIGIPQNMQETVALQMKQLIIERSAEGVL